ncbi:AfsR/SARP family transcriptional regulator [Nocardia sp. SYP-A9097]|uniref:BTAD domain-containing putative transcriptional regulator n=1 Tax=Nocardia sp. SYP-A9097 TaxID=2663237 RepID=UPI0013280453|nr:BTAD domain-containing putative transcriptional regulator [Nocardia sp. SYP-A9097]MRH89436.1 AfsR/SARP family transcriptional regulator [Nocardia sp. SYP-A9097]
MRVGVLGPVVLWAEDGASIEIGGVRVRMLLARLALEAGGAVPVAALIDGLWGEEPPAEAGGALQALVSRLRRALRGVGTVELTAGGYRLPGVEVDAERFEELVKRGRRELAAGQADSAAAVLAEALGLWRGPVLGDIEDAPFVQAVAARLEDLRAAAVEDRFAAELQLGRYAEILVDLEVAGAEHPLSERLAALRMRALAAAGRQSDALAVYEDMRERLGDELGIDPSAELRDTHLALLRGELESPAARREPVGSTLPARLTSFVGRDSELDAVARLLADSRLVTIVGPGGAGKTRLTLEAMSRYRSGPVFFVPLAEIGAPDQLADAVAGALDSGGDGLPADKTARLAELLDVGAAVLVLDNCEHLIAAAAELAERLLNRLPQLRILATSREPLAITGEVLCHLGPLAIPGEATEPTAAQRFPAVRLFLDRVAAIRPGFTLDERTIGPVVEICRQLDGVPLALELAAAKLRSMSVDQIARRLDDRFRLLTSGSRTALPRQRTLLALVEWSWDLLEEPERVLARRLSIFPGGATIEALEAICADDSLPADDILYILGALVEKSVVESSDGDRPRYRMLETIRAYAADQLAASADDLADAFAQQYLNLAEQLEPLLRTSEQLSAIAVFDAEHANMAAALRASSATEPVDTVSVRVKRACRFARAMFWYWGIRGMSSQFETAVAGVLRFGDALPADARAAFRVIQLMAGAPAEETVSVAELIADCDRTGALDFHPALPLWTSLLAFQSGDTELGERQLERALEWPDPWLRASAHLARDLACTGRGELLAGAAERREALRDFEIAGDRWGLGLALLAVGRDHSLRGAHQEAIAAFGRAVVVASELGMEDDVFNSRTELTRERMRSGDLAGAESDIRAAERVAEERGYTRMAAILGFSRAELHRRTGDVAQADRDLELIEQRLRRLPVPEGIALNRIAMARMANRLADNSPAAARKRLPEVIEGSFIYGDVAAVTEALAQAAELLAKLRLQEDDPTAAATALGMSAVIRGVFDDGEPELRTLITDLVTRLGEEGFRAAYLTGSDLPREAALTRLRAETPTG